MKIQFQKPFARLFDVVGYVLFVSGRYQIDKKGYWLFFNWRRENRYVRTGELTIYTVRFFAQDEYPTYHSNTSCHTCKRENIEGKLYEIISTNFSHLFPEQEG